MPQLLFLRSVPSRRESPLDFCRTFALRRVLGLPKPPCQERKTRYLENLRHASLAVRRVSLADKLHNARSLLAQWRQKGDTIWTEFTRGKEGTLWFYRSLVQVYRETGSDFMTDELDRVVLELCQDDNQ